MSKIINFRYDIEKKFTTNDGVTINISNMNNTNDYDFMPLIDVLKTLGVNITLIKLNSLPVNKELVENCDSFCVPDKQELLTLFS